MPKHVDERAEESQSGQALKDNGYFYPGEADTAITVVALIGNKCNTATLSRSL